MQTCVMHADSKRQRQLEVGVPHCGNDVLDLQGPPPEMTRTSLLLYSICSGVAGSSMSLLIFVNNSIVLMLQGKIYHVIIKNGDNI